MGLGWKTAQVKWLGQIIQAMLHTACLYILDTEPDNVRIYALYTNKQLQNK